MGRPTRADAPAVLHVGSGAAAKATRPAAAAGASAAPVLRKKRRSSSTRKLYRLRPTLPNAGDDENAAAGDGSGDQQRDMEPDALHSLDDIVALIAANEDFEVTPAPATTAATVPPVVNRSRPPLPTVVIKDESGTGSHAREA